MDDLNGLDWSSSSKPNNSNTRAPPAGSGSYYPSLRPTPPPASSGRSTPLSSQGSGIGKTPLPGKSSTPDSFANLVSFGSSKSANNLSLQEQQRKLEEEKARRDAEQRRQFDAQFGGVSSFANRQPSKNPFSGPSLLAAPPKATQAPIPSLRPSSIVNGNSATSNGDDDDLFAAFNADTKVDNASHYPPPSRLDISTPPQVQKKPLDLSNPQAWEKPSESSVLGELRDDDDDPFGLSAMRGRNASATSQTAITMEEEEEDFLGDLAKPVEEVKKKARPISQPPAANNSHNSQQSESDDPWDKAVGELVDMGFTAENARRALTESGAGLDVQAAVSWLLNDAHRQAKERSQGRSGSETRGDQEHGSRSNGTGRERSSDRSQNEALPAWMRQDSEGSRPRRDDSQSPVSSDNDVAKLAAAVGSNFLKQANSLWKTGQKKVQKAVADFQHESDPSQPKWMRDAAGERQRQPENHQIREKRPSQPEKLGRETSSSATDEALMLESRRPAAKSERPTPSGSTSRDQSPAFSAGSHGRSTPISRWQQTVPTTASDAKSRLSKQAIEEQTAQAYVSPARRKMATSQTKSVGVQDMLFGDSNSNAPPIGAKPEPKRTIPTQPSRPPVKSSKPSTPIPFRPKAPPRNIPPLSSTALAASTEHRLAGSEHFKRGDYASAHQSYTSSLSSLPNTHPITIILLCNRSLTALKTGDPKAAVSDADAAIAIIGPSRGENEFIDLQSESTGDSKKDMKEFWGKALMRKAEALEQMERWSDARAVWKEAVEAGVGGATAVQGRQRCDKALQPKTKPSTTPKPAAKPAAQKPKSSALGDLAPAPAQSIEAVNRLRAANAAADKADDEKFALSDSVDARISKWRDGRRDNLRALLGGMDQVLWEGSGWKKIGMHELVVNSKVKINYMKAIAKVHPDKLPQDATTEMQMISGAVFATLNEAWDKFKTENGM